MSIGECIKEWREKRGITQSGLADALGVSDKTVSSWEINRTEPKMGMVQNLAKVLKCRVSDIIGENEEFEESYYIDDEAREMAEFMYKNPEYKVLFDASRKVKKEDIQFVKEFMDRMRPAEPDDTGC